MFATLRLLVVAALVVSTGSPATAASRPTVSISTSSTTAESTVAIIVSGTVSGLRTSAKIKFQASVGSGWKTVRTLKVSRSGGYATTYLPILGRNYLRMVVPKAKSRKKATSRTAGLDARPLVSTTTPLATDLVQVRGAMPTKVARTVELQVLQNGQWVRGPTGRTSSAGVVTLATRVSSSGAVRFTAPRTKVKKKTYGAFTSPATNVTVTSGPLVQPGDLSSTPTPTISGSAVVGQDLGAVTGDWGSDVILTYAWRRGDVVISAATGDVFRVGVDDIGERLSVTVTGTRTGYRTTSKVSDKTQVVPPPTPTINGPAEVGMQVTVQRGGWPAGTTLAQRWLRDGQPIQAATGETYSVASGDELATLSVAVTATRIGHASVTVTSAGVKVPTKKERALRAARAALAHAATSPVDVLVAPSDSGTEGYAVSSVEKRWISLFRDRLRADYQPPGVPGGFGYADLWNQGEFLDYPITPVDPALYYQWFGLGRQSVVLGGSASEQSITVRGTFTDLDILYVGSRDRSWGVLGYSVDGGPKRLVDTGQSERNGAGQAIRVGGLPRGHHEVTITHESGAVIVVEGVMMYDGDTDRGVRIWEGGQNGATSDFYDTPYDVWAESLADLHPDLIVLPIGSNDFGVGKSPAETKVHIRSLIALMRSRIDTDPSIVLVSTYDRWAVPEQTHSWSEYVDMYRELAAEDPDVSLFDLGPFFGPWEGNNRGGLTDATDMIHPSDAGSVVIADALADFIVN